MAGLGVAFLGLLADHTAVKGFLFAALLVATGLGLRVEAAIVDHAGSRGTRGTPAPADKSADWYR